MIELVHGKLWTNDIQRRKTGFPVEKKQEFDQTNRVF